MGLRNYVLLIILISSISITYSQSAGPEVSKLNMGITKGYVVDISGDTIDGNILSINTSQNEKRIIFYDTSGRKSEFYPSEIKAYGYMQKSKEICYESKNTPNSSFFMNRLVNGSLKLYSSARDEYFLQSGDEDWTFVNLSNKHSRQKASKYLMGNPELEEKLINHEIRTKNDFIKLVRDYNGEVSENPDLWVR